MKLPYEFADKTVKHITIYEYTILLVQEGLIRDWNNLQHFFPFLEKYNRNSNPERVARNVNAAV